MDWKRRSGISRTSIEGRHPVLRMPQLQTHIRTHIQQVKKNKTDALPETAPIEQGRLEIQS